MRPITTQLVDNNVCNILHNPQPTSPAPAPRPRPPLPPVDRLLCGVNRIRALVGFCLHQTVDFVFVGQDLHPPMDDWWPRCEPCLSASSGPQPLCVRADFTAVTFTVSCVIIDINSIKRKMDTQYTPENLHIMVPLDYCIRTWTRDQFVGITGGKQKTGQNQLLSVCLTVCLSSSKCHENSGALNKRTIN